MHTSVIRLARALALASLVAFGAGAQSSTTTVTGTLTDPTGGHPSGTCSFQNARRFVSGNNFNVIGVPRVVAFTSGAISVALVPTDGALTPGTLFYQKTCRAPLQTPSGASCEADPSLIAGGTCTVGPYTWGPTYLQVPVSSSPVALEDIESDAVPPPNNAQWRDTWISTETYRLGEIVSCPAGSACGSLVPGASYISRAYANVGNNPSSSPLWWRSLVGEFMAAVPGGPGVLKVIAGVPSVVSGSSSDCVRVDGSSAECVPSTADLPADGTFCLTRVAGVNTWAVCNVTPAALSWGSLISSQWAALTSSTWATLSN